MTMKVVLNKMILERLNACENGYIFYNDLVGDSDKLEIEWTPEKDMWICMFPEIHAWLRQHNIIPRAIFTGMEIINKNLEGARLCRADFTCCFLENVNFKNADLRGANFTGAKIVNCNFDQAQLEGVVGII